MTMTSRERVLAVLNHETPDRVPIVLGPSNATGVKMGTYRRIKELIGVQSEDRYIYDWPELGTADMDEATLDRLHSDVRGVLDLEPASVMERNRQREPHSPHFNSWGGGAIESEPGSWFPGIHPLENATTLEELEAHAWPDMDDPTRVAHVSARAKQLADENQYGIVATPWLLFPLERAFEMQRMDKFLMNMVKHPDFARALLEKNASMCKTLMGHFLRECGDNIDIIKIGDDLGMNTSLLMSPKMYRAILKPIHADYIAFIKQHTKAKLMFHTDGDILPLIPDFIEMGVDILNPIQTSAGKMSDLQALKTQFGKDIVFCGAIDNLQILPFGTPQQVRDEVKRVISVLGEGGGYMLGAVHTVMNDVPAENVLAMVDAVEEFGYY
ncbi:MAG: uroporphyrinogen decarboxylase family protein [Chloroflexota bacterium]